MKLKEAMQEACKKYPGSSIRFDKTYEYVPGYVTPLSKMSPKLRESVKAKMAQTPR